MWVGSTESTLMIIFIIFNSGIQSLDDFQSALVYIQPRVNPYLFIYCLSVAVIHRNDTRNFRLPSHACSFPELYVDGAVLAEVRATGSLFASSSRVSKAIK